MACSFYLCTWPLEARVPTDHCVHAVTFIVRFGRHRVNSASQCFFYFLTSVSVLRRPASSLLPCFRGRPLLSGLSRPHCRSRLFRLGQASAWTLAQPVQMCPGLHLLSPVPGACHSLHLRSCWTCTGSEFTGCVMDPNDQLKGILRQAAGVESVSCRVVVSRGALLWTPGGA